MTENQQRQDVVIKLNKVSQYLLLLLSKRKQKKKNVSLKQLVRDNPKYSAKQTV